MSLLSHSHRAASAGHDAVLRVLLSPPPRADGQAHPKTRVKCVSRLTQPRGPASEYTAAPRRGVGASPNGGDPHQRGRRRPEPPECRRNHPRADGGCGRFGTEACARLPGRIVRSSVTAIHWVSKTYVAGAQGPVRRWRRLVGSVLDAPVQFCSGGMPRRGARAAKAPYRCAPAGRGVPTRPFRRQTLCRHRLRP